VIELLARLVWSGFLIETNKERKFSEEHMPSKNLYVLRKKKGDEFSIYISSVMEKAYPNLVHGLPNHLLELLGCSIPRILDKGKDKDIAGNLEENLAFLKKHETSLNKMFNAAKKHKIHDYDSRRLPNWLQRAQMVPLDD